MSLYIVDVPLLSLILYIDVAIYLYIHSFIYQFFYLRHRYAIKVELKLALNRRDRNFSHLERLYCGLN